jgi:hypothetical protein
MLLPVLLASGCRPAEPAPDPFKKAKTEEASPLGPPPQRTIYRVGGEVTRPVRIEKCEPKLPEYLKKKRITQPVFIYEALISSSGVVESIRSVKTKPLGEPYATMERAFREAILCSRFRPATLRGKPVACRYMLTTSVEVR